MKDLVLANIDGRIFFDSRQHIKGDVRIKRNCKEYVWQYRDKEDSDGANFGACVGLDVEELNYLKERGVRFYRCIYPSGSYTINIDKFFEWAVPVVNRPGDREQICVSIRHWDYIPKGGTKKEKPIKVKLAKPRRVKTWTQSDLLGFLGKH